MEEIVLEVEVKKSYSASDWNPTIVLKHGNSPAKFINSKVDNEFSKFCLEHDIGIITSDVLDSVQFDKMNTCDGHGSYSDHVVVTAVMLCAGNHRQPDGSAIFRITKQRVELGKYQLEQIVELAKKGLEAI